MSISTSHLFLRRAGLWLTILLSIIVVVMSARFFNFERQDILMGKPDALYAASWYQLSFYTHVGAGMIALLLGPFQFMRSLRNRYLSWHRRLGKIYLIAIAIGGITGLIIALQAEGGWVGRSGFLGMSTAWLISGYIAWRAILRKEVERHQRWMIRNFAVTFAAVSLRLGLLLTATGWLTFAEIYPILAWASWVLNLIFVEWLIIRPGQPKAYDRVTLSKG